MFIEISDNLKKLAKYFPENLYVVGGYVRNKLLNISCLDVDIASSVNLEDLAKRLEGSGYEVKIKNQKLGTLLISKGDEHFEYTAFRKETYSKESGHSPVVVEKTERIEEDAVRRDFSVNSIYYNINKDEIVDFYHGIVDLKEKLIRCNIDPELILQFDGERILRMVRFAGELDFRIDKKTLAAAKKYISNLDYIQGNRKFAELEKILNCDKKYGLNNHSLSRALNLLNILGAWQHFGLKAKQICFKMVYKTENRLLGFLIDVVDTEKPECLETFIMHFLKEQFGLSAQESKKHFDYLAGYYYALNGMQNKEYFFKYYRDWAFIYPLIGKKSKRVQSKYNFFYQYIIEHGLVIETSDLDLTENDLKINFKNIDKRSYNRIMLNLLSKVFDGKLQNTKPALLAEIEKNLQNY